jgi:general stress protein CsbA
VEFHCRINPATITRRMKRLILFARNLFINYLAISLMCVLLAPIKNRTYDASGLWCDRLYLIRIKRVMTLVRGTLTNWKQFCLQNAPNRAHRKNLFHPRIQISFFASSPDTLTKSSICIRLCLYNKIEL